MDNLITYILIFISVNYAILILCFTYYLITEKIFINTKKISHSNNIISIIIAVRNESKNIAPLIKSLNNQDYDGKYEVIIINDHSCDNTLEILQKEEFSSKIKVLNLPENKFGKKEALKYGVSFAKGDILAFTDADCILPTSWLKSMINKFTSGDYCMICGPVEFYGKNNLFISIVKLEFLSLTGIGAAGFFMGKPFMCNGANYLIYKNSYNEYSKNIRNEFSSGDDVFILHSVKKHNKVGFCYSPEAIVETKAPESLSEFINQRIRWGSKIKGYKDIFSLYVSISSFLMSIIFGVSLIAMLLSHDNFIFQWVIVLKLILDYFILFVITDFYNKKYLLKNFLLFEILHPIYLISIGILSLFLKPKWKGRRIS